MTDWTVAVTLVAMADPHQQPPTYPHPIYGLPQPPKSGLATASLVCGVIGLVTFICSLGVPSLAAIILGTAALADTKRGAKSGHSTAKAGMVLGYVGVVPPLVVLALKVAGIRP